MRQAAPGAAHLSGVNGPQGEILDWNSVDWACVEENVRRLRQRIFKAAQEGDLKKVRNLQKLMLRSRSNTLVSVKRVTQQSRGRKTAGISALDSYVWTLTYKWAKRTDPKKPKYWIVNKYFGRLNRTRNNNWVFGDRTTGAHLPKFSWTTIRRHQLVKGKSSPDDPALHDYWSQRRKTRTPPPMDKISLALAARQEGICPLCGQTLIVGAEYEPDNPREWIEWFDTMKKRLHKHHFTYRRNGGSDESNNLRLVHSECHRQHHAGDSNRIKLQTL
jgi:hypothetical protein